jgi:hypothetical protein
MDHRNERPLSELVRDLMTQVSNMVRHEMGLVRAEMSEKASVAGSGVGMLGGALALGIPAIAILLLSAVAALSETMDVWLAALIVGAIAAIVAAIMAAKGKANLKARNLAPDRTMESLRSDAQLVRERVR